MNDSFLEDLELPCTLKPSIVDRNVTTRAVASSTFINLEGEEESCDKKQLVEEPNGKDSKKLSDHEISKRQTNAKISERKEKHEESKFKPIEDKVLKYESSSKEHKPRVRFAESKAVGEDNALCSGNYKENAKATTSKENSRSDSSKDEVSQVEDPIEKTKGCDKKLESMEIDHTALLKDIENIVSMNCQKEASRILKAMNDVHINTQASFIRHLLVQSDEIVDGIHSVSTCKRIKKYIEEIEKLREERSGLEKKVDKLKDKLVEMEFFKQELEFYKKENKALKKDVNKLTKELKRP